MSKIIIEPVSCDLAEALCRNITADLPEYFGLPEVNKHYALGVGSRLNFAAKIGKEYLGLMSIEFPYPENANIYWMGVLRKHHRKGVGKSLLKQASLDVKKKGAQTLSVETLSPQEAHENYLKTYQFYTSLGFSPLFNSKPEGYAWTMVYMVKGLDPLYPEETQGLSIRPLIKEDIPHIVSTFAQIGWHKPVSLFEGYLKEQEAGERLVWVAHLKSEFAGYVTLKWQPEYPAFNVQNVPEIIDLNVQPAFRNMGIGSRLLDTAEKEAATKSHIIGIGVGLYAGEDGGYGMAQRLYVKRGYLPDGKGLTYQYKPTIPGNSYPLDDDLVLWFTKKLR